MDKERFRRFMKYAIVAIGAMLVQRGKLDPAAFETIAGGATILFGGGDDLLDATTKSTPPA